MSNENDNKNNSNLSRTDSTVDEGKKIVLMKKGDYSVHILLEEVKSLIQINPDHLP